MKKILLVCGAAFLAFAVNAQDNKMEAKPQAEPAMKVQPVSHEGMIMKGGKIYVMSEGKVTLMDKEMEMPNGSKLMTDGTVVMSDGTKMMMKDGDRMNMNGELKQRQANKMNETKMEEKKMDDQK